MKKMKRLASGLVWMLTACMTMFSCSDKEDFMQTVEEGLPISVEFSLTTPKPNEVTTRATDDQETKVEKLALFFYYMDGTLAFAYELPASDVVKMENVSTSTNYKYQIRIPETAGLTSGTYYLYAVANWDRGFWNHTMTFDKLAAMNKKQMDEFCVLKTNKQLEIIETSILLSGKYGNGDGKVVFERTNANNGVNVLQDVIHLKRSLAKMIFNFNLDPQKVPAGVTFVPESFDVYNYCNTATMMERAGWGTQGVSPGTLTWMGSADAGNFSNVIGNPIKGNTFTFYMPENVQIAKAAVPSQIEREKREKTQTTDPANPDKVIWKNGAFTYAPEHATYVVVRGRYTGPVSSKPGGDNRVVSADVSYTILLGDFSKNAQGTANAAEGWGNFTTRRNTKYTYNVTIKGVNNIVTEATAENETIEPQPGAEGDVVVHNSKNTKILDAHYETCMLEIPKSVFSIMDGTNATLAEEFGIVLQTPKTHIVEGQIESLAGADYTWVKFMKPASSTQFSAYPGTGNAQLFTLQDLITKLTPSEGPNGALVAPNYGEIFYEDTAKPDYYYLQAFVDEFYYTDLPLEQFVNAPRRVMTIATATTVSPDGQSTFSQTPVFSIVQRSIKSMFNMKVNNPFGVEVTDKGQESWTDDNATYLTQSQNETSIAANKTDGWNNTKLNSNIQFGSSRWDAYINVGTNQLKQNYGIYQFLSRNRDENGNGIIEESEIKWYVPALNQYLALWCGYPAFPEAAILNHTLYFSSTQGQGRTLWANEGAYGKYKTTDKDPTAQAGGQNFTRCIRALGQNSAAAPTTEFYAYDAATRTISVGGFGGHAVRAANSQEGEYVTHFQNDAANKLPEAFQVAQGDLVYTTPGTPGVGGDEYVPFIQIANAKNSFSDGWFFDENTVTFDLTIVKDVNRPNEKYYWATDLNGAKTEIVDYSKKGNKISKKNGIGASSTSLYIFAENGNYVVLSCELANNAKVNQKAVVIDKNQSTGGTPSTSQSVFTTQEVSTKDLCADYYENDDLSQKGKWRIPNQRELTLMHLNSTKGDNPQGGLTLSAYTASRTLYQPKNQVYYVQNSLDFITTDDTKKTGFVVRCVRDVAPKSGGTVGYDSSLNNGGALIK